jgi:ribosome-associated protein
MPEPLPIDDRHVLPGDELTLTYSRAGGAGGQHVNTTDTRVRLRFALSTTTALSEPVKRRLRAANPSWVNGEGDVQLTCDTNRSRKRNIDEARRRLAAAIRAVLVPPRPRRATKPSRGVHRRRLNAKKQRGKLKQTRGKVGED